MILDNLDEAVAKASGDGRYRFSLRQLFYVVRPKVMEACGAELMYGNFEAVIADHENENGPIPGLYRDPRGTLYHPHTRESIPLGTIAVEEYRRPEWTFGRLLYSEKEGLLEILKADGWPERNDCALVSVQGLHHAGGAGPDRPARRRWRTDQGVLHPRRGRRRDHDLPDAGGGNAGSGARRIEVINLGLEPWQALAMGLEPETVERSERRAAVADYVSQRPGRGDWGRMAAGAPGRAERDDGAAVRGLARREMAKHGGGKVIPPEEVAVDRYTETLEQAVRERETERILAEAGLDDVVDEALRGLEIPDGAELLQDVSEHFRAAPQDRWAACVDTLAREAASPWVR